MDRIHPLLRAVISISQRRTYHFWRGHSPLSKSRGKKSAPTRTSWRSQVITKPFKVPQCNARYYITSLFPYQLYRRQNRLIYVPVKHNLWVIRIEGMQFKTSLVMAVIRCSTPWKKPYWYHSCLPSWIHHHCYHGWPDATGLDTRQSREQYSSSDPLSKATKIFNTVVNSWAQHN